MNANPRPVNPPPVPAPAVLAQLWQSAGLDPAALQRCTPGGAEPALASALPIGTELQAALAAAALAGSEVARQRGAGALPVQVDRQDVLRESACRFTLDGRTPPAWDKLSGLYRCRDEASGADTQPWVRVHANFAHHRDGVLTLLGLPTGATTERAAVAAALREWSAGDFERAAAERGLVVAALRSPAQWAAHPQAAVVAAQPLLRIERSGDAAARPWPAWPADSTGPAAPAQTENVGPAAPLGISGRPGAAQPAIRPLAGLRVLELTRILAGPVAGRTLAALGAEVLLVNSPHLPNIEALADTSRGKRSALLDLRQPAARDTLRQLVADCDVFLHGYRPGALAALGFGSDDLERLRPGLVSASLSAYGTEGPWGGRRGFDSLVQSATGLNLAEAQALGQAEPRALPLQALDYGAGYLLAFGAVAALLRQRQQGGHWRVQLSLAGVGHWLQGLGRNADPAAAPALDFNGVFEEHDSGFGRLRAVRHAVQLGGQRLGWDRPSMPPGSHPPAWLAAPA